VNNTSTVNNIKETNIKETGNNTKSDNDLHFPRYEKFSASLLLVAGFIYLALWLISIFSETTSFINVADDKVSMNMSELLSHIRTVITIGLALGGGFLILRRSRAGWVMGIIVLILLLIISSGTVYQAIKLKEPALIAIATTCWLILLLSIVFLALPSVRQKFHINKPLTITATLLSFLLAVFYFFVQ
jgi:lysylphosphatidylglycerol synthetase-like protein (DUF2156 family)